MRFSKIDCNAHKVQSVAPFLSIKVNAMPITINQQMCVSSRYDYDLLDPTFKAFQNSQPFEIKNRLAPLAVTVADVMTCNNQAGRVGDIPWHAG